MSGDPRKDGASQEAGRHCSSGSSSRSGSGSGSVTLSVAPAIRVAIDLTQHAAYDSLKVNTFDIATSLIKTRGRNCCKAELPLSSAPERVVNLLWRRFWQLHAARPTIDPAAFD
eukprot:jgi/Hompol1/4626/HPOL_003779-RA